MSTVGQKTQHFGEETGHLIGQHPLPSALTAFGAGLGLGLLIAMSLPRAPQEQEAAITKRVLDALSHILPDAVTRRIS